MLQRGTQWALKEKGAPQSLTPPKKRPGDNVILHKTGAAVDGRYSKKKRREGCYRFYGHGEGASRIELGTKTHPKTNQNPRIASERHSVPHAT